MYSSGWPHLKPRRKKCEWDGFLALRRPVSEVGGTAESGMAWSCAGSELATWTMERERSETMIKRDCLAADDCGVC